MKRPMLYWVCLFVLGEVIGIINQMLLVLCIGILMTVMVVILTKVNIIKLQNGLLHIVGVMFFLVGLVCIQTTNYKLENVKALYEKNILFIGEVIAIDEQKQNYTLKLQAGGEAVCKTEVEIPRITTYALAHFSDENKLLLGDVVYGSGIAKGFRNSTNPGGYDEERYYYGKGCFLQIEKGNVSQIERSSFSYKNLLHYLQSQLSTNYLRLLPQEDAGLACAMVLGDKSNLDSEIKELYQKNGIAHLIAISGLHIAMIGGTIYSLLRKIFGGFVIPFIIGVTFILAYGTMTGLSGSTVRAIIMLVTVIGADLVGRKYDILSSLSLALFVMLVMNPLQITQAGFLLSFGAVIGIAVINPIWEDMFPKMPKLLKGIFVSISVSLVIAPVTLYFFFEMPSYGMILNLIVIPLMTILLFVLIVCGMLYFLFPQLAIKGITIAHGIFWFYKKVCLLNQNAPGNCICTGRPSMWWIILYYLLLATFVVVIIYLTRREKKKRKKEPKSKMTRQDMKYISVLYVFCLLGLFGYYLLPSSLIVTSLDVGQGDCIMIQSTNRECILIDGGSSTKQNIGKYVIENGLKYYGNNHIDYAVISHMDSDHYCGIKEILENDIIGIECIILPAINNPDDGYWEMVTLAKEKGCKVLFFQKGDYIESDRIKLECLNPKSKSYEDKNTGSIVFMMYCDEFKGLFTGDMDLSVEEELLKDDQCCKKIQNLDYLKVSHHGSRTASGEDFVSLLNPRISVISAGIKNRYGHPHKETIDTLESVNSQILQTKDLGAIEIRKKRDKILLRTYGKNGECVIE